MFLFSVFSGLAIVLTFMLGKPVIERGPSKYIKMNESLFLEVFFYEKSIGFVESGAQGSSVYGKF